MTLNDTSDGQHIKQRMARLSPTLRAFSCHSWLLCLCLLLATGTASAQEPIRIGSKDDVETGILGEVLAALARQAGAEVEAEVIAAGSGTVFAAITGGDIDAYVEYTGTLTGSTLASLNLTSDAELETALAERGLKMTPPLGFNNTYALAVRGDLAEELGLATTSDLAAHPELRVAVSSEWFGRADGWPQLKAAYGLPQEDVTALGEHRLLYRALTSGQTDVIEVYTTEAAIEANGLVVLEDDLGFFPQYRAFVLYRETLEQTHPRVVARWREMAGTLDEAAMTALNARVEGGNASNAAAASVYLAEHFADAAGDVSADQSLASRVWQRTVEHAGLVAASMALGILLAVPLGLLAATNAGLGRGVLAGVGIIQTVPSIALLVFMIPLLGIGPAPAIAALFLYSLLPMVRNTHEGLTGIARPVRESAEALGLSWWQRLTRVEMPLALPAILAGVKTSAVITVGFATLGGFIGAGGYGETIFQGLRVDSTRLTLEGAVPAAVMALLVQLGLDGVSRLVVSRGLRA